MVNLSKVDYRARETIKLLNQFRGVATYECCMGHLESRMNGSVTRYIPGLVLEKDRWYLDGKPMLSSEAQRLFSEGATGDNNVHINPISEIYSSNHQSLSRTYSVLRLSLIHI